MRLTIKLKLALSFAIVIALVGGMATLAISNLASLNSAITEIVAGPAADLDNIRGLSLAFNESIRAEKNSILNQDPAQIEGYVKTSNTNSDKALEFVASLQKSTNPEIASAADEFLKSYRDRDPLRKRILELGQINTTESNAEAAQISMVGTKQLNNTLFGLLESMSTKISEDLHKTDQETNDLYATSRMLLLTFIAAVTLLSVGIAAWMSLSIARGLKRGVELAEAVALGDLNHDVAHKANDEIKDLISAMQRMTANLRETAGMAAEISNGNLTVTPKPLSDKDILGKSLLDMVERLRSVVSDALVASDNVSAGSQQLSSGR